MDDLEPFSKIVGLVSNYRGDKKIDDILKHIDLIELSLGMKKICLSNEEIEIVDFFEKYAINNNESLEKVIISEDELTNKLKLHIINLGNDGLNKLSIYKEKSMDYCNYSINYDFYWKTDFLDKKFNFSLSFYELVIILLDYIKNNLNENEYITPEKLSKSSYMEDILIFNPVLYYLKQKDILTFSSTQSILKPFISNGMTIKSFSNLKNLKEKINIYKY